MKLDGVLGNTESRCNLAIPNAFSKQAKNFRFTWREIFCQVTLAPMFGHERAVDSKQAEVNGPDCMNDLIRRGVASQKSSACRSHNGVEQVLIGHGTKQHNREAVDDFCQPLSSRIQVRCGID